MFKISESLIQFEEKPLVNNEKVIRESSELLERFRASREDKKGGVPNGPSRLD
jgi:hypothetical protein